MSHVPDNPLKSREERSRGDLAKRWQEVGFIKAGRLPNMGPNTHTSSPKETHWCLHWTERMYSKSKIWILNYSRFGISQCPSVVHELHRGIEIDLGLARLQNLTRGNELIWSKICLTVCHLYAFLIWNVGRNKRTDVSGEVKVETLFSQVNHLHVYFLLRSRVATTH